MLGAEIVAPYPTLAELPPPPGRAARALRLLTIVGARPQFVVTVAVSRAIREHNVLAPSPRWVYNHGAGMT